MLVDGLNSESPAPSRPRFEARNVVESIELPADERVQLSMSGTGLAVSDFGAGKAKTAQVHQTFAINHEMDISLPIRRTKMKTSD